MAQLFAIALSFPAVVFTVLLGVSLVYWAFVIVGAARVNLLGDGAADGIGDGAADGALDGAGLEHVGGAEHVGGEHVGGAEHLEGDAGDLHDGGEAHGALAGMMAALKLRSAPATVVLSCLVLFAWVFAMLGMQAAFALVPAGAMIAARVAIFVLAPVLALFPTSVAVRPLARVFVPEAAPAHEDLVGKVCVVRTGTVTDRFGEATLEDGAAGVVVRVRVDAGEEALKRGDEAVIVGYDEARKEFTVAPMALDDDPPARRASRR